MPPLHFRGDVAEDEVAAVGLVQVRHFENHSAAGGTGRKGKGDVFLRALGLDDPRLFKSFDAALHLSGLCGLIAKTLNKGLGLGSFSFLAFRRLFNLPVALPGALSTGKRHYRS